MARRISITVPEGVDPNERDNPKAPSSREEKTRNFENSIARFVRDSRTVAKAEQYDWHFSRLEPWQIAAYVKNLEITRANIQVAIDYLEGKPEGVAHD